MENKFIKELENGNIEVTTKDGVFELEEQEYSVVEQAEKLANKSKADEDLLLLSRSIVKVNGEPKQVGDVELKKLKGSSVMKLKWAINKLYGALDFLPELQQSKIDLKQITDNEY